MYPHAPHSPLSEAGNDYTSVSMDLTFSATITSQTVMIMTSTDNVLEDDEEFTLSLTTGDSAVTVTTPSATVTLTDETSKCTNNHAHRALQNIEKEKSEGKGRTSTHKQTHPITLTALYIH